MTEIKTAQAWGHRSSPSALLNHAGRKSEMFNIPYVIVHGLTEAEVHEAAVLLARSREVCEHRDTGIGTIRTGCDISYPVNQQHVERPCWCGRAVAVKG